jgi:broad specificity phosphatase PhoE
MSTTYYLTRHALATHSLTGYGDQILTAEILPEGIPPIKKMASFLATQSIGNCFVSEIIRCQQTAQIISAATHCPFITDGRLNEYYPRNFTDFLKRVENFLNEVEQKHFDKVLLCTHGAVVAAIKNLLAQKSVTEEVIDYEYPLPGTLWIIDKDHLIEKDFNEVSR